MEPLGVVAKYVDGRVVKGYVNNFSPEKPFFHIYPITADTTREGMKVYIKDLKAVFFVRDFIGEAEYDERVEITGKQHPNGRPAEVEFKDGEVLYGIVSGHDPRRPGFFLFPSDPQSNNVRAFLVLAAVREIAFLTSFMFHH